MNKKVLLFTLFLFVLLFFVFFGLYFYYTSRTGDYFIKFKVPTLRDTSVVEKYPVEYESQIKSFRVAGFLDKIEGNKIKFYSIEMTDNPTKVAIRIDREYLFDDSTVFPCTRTETYLQGPDGQPIPRSEVLLYFADDKQKEEYAREGYNEIEDGRVIPHEEISEVPQHTKLVIQGFKKEGEAEYFASSVHFTFPECY